MFAACGTQLAKIPDYEGVRLEFVGHVDRSTVFRGELQGDTRAGWLRTATQAG
jgi:hypothetical protein